MLRAHRRRIGFELPTFPDLTATLRQWICEDGLWWAKSATAHALILSIAMLIAGAVFTAPQSDAARPCFESASIDTAIAQINITAAGDTPAEPDVIAPDPIFLESAAATASVMVPDDTTRAPPDSPGTPGGIVGPTGWRPGLPFDRRVWVAGPGGVNGGAEDIGTGSHSGPGGGSFAHRLLNARRRRPNGATDSTQRAVARSLDWLARHQNADGSWSLDGYTVRCTDATCTGAGHSQLDCAATALALLPFLGAGQTHTTRGPYQKTVRSGLYWLQQHQAPDGDLTGSQHMYSQGLAAIVLCEAYGLSRDNACGQAALLAIQFIERAQHPQTGGWRYEPRDEGDTSVLGWQLMALKSAQMAGLPVSSRAMAGAQRWLKSVGDGAGQFSYVPAGGASPAMCAVGLLGTQYLGADRQAAELQGGTTYLLAHLPDIARRDVYYWYYATQVMHNMPGPEWDTWNRAMRKILIATQATRGCAAGSWDPSRPAADRYGDAGGRLMMTSLSALTLEVYYRYLPLYQFAAGEPRK